MKTKIFCSLFAMILMIAMFVSCEPGNGGETEDNNNIIPGCQIKYNYNWSKTTVKMELTNNTQYDELSSGCERYYAGTAANAFDPIDILVRDRNRQAAAAANVTLSPSYVGNTSEYSWGANIVRISQAAITENSANPDIYCNFAYDLTCAQLRGAFSNLKDNSYSNGNFFRFNDSDYNPTSDSYFDSKAGEGYFYDYMQSLSLSSDKMYCLASNYCTDLVRAFLVVPVNIEMLNSIQAKDSWTGDMIDYNDFYDLVWRDPARVAQNEKYNDGWSYEVLAHYAQKVYSERNGADSKLDDILGFIAGTTSGTPSTGFIYTSNVKIIARTQDPNTKKFTFTYPQINTNLNLYAEQITKLFQENANRGVITVKTPEAVAYDTAANTELQMIRNKFSKNEVLFGGIICLGSLEDTVYQNMRVGGGEGFGIVPVPLYRSVDENGEQQNYQTMVHNVARIIAIARATTCFSQCSAYLDCVSRTSTDVIEIYYNDILAGKVGGIAAAQNNRMLTYIRNHVRDCFDKTYEDAVANKYAATHGDAAAIATKWHEILGNMHGFIYPSFANDYAAQAKQKQSNLDEVVAEWNSKT